MEDGKQGKKKTPRRQMSRRKVFSCRSTSFGKYQSPWGGKGKTPEDESPEAFSESITYFVTETSAKSALFPAASTKILLVVVNVRPSISVPTQPSPAAIVIVISFLLAPV